MSNTDPRVGIPFRCGTPSMEEWKGLWRSQPQDSLVCSPEFEIVASRLGELLIQLGADSEVYVRGDNFGDRTQYLEPESPSAFTERLVHAVQSWLAEPEFRSWRVLCRTYLGESGAVIVYPELIRVGSRFSGLPLGKALEEIAAAMRAADPS